MTDNANYVTELEEQRKEKDWFFKKHPQAPLTPEQQESFTRLSYFPVNEDLRFLLPLTVHEEKKTIQVEDSKGGVQTFLRWGAFTFTVDGSTYTLQAYKHHPSDNNLWVPFRDETNNKETYGAGRYLDLTEGADTIDGQWVLDFNLAYNPFCAYSEDYVCPFIPPENWLKTSIRAGEKAYTGPKQQTEFKFE
jgi:uncharacterized protein